MPARLARVLAVLLLAAASCQDATGLGRLGPPYLVIVPRVSTAKQASLVGTLARYRVQMLSEPSTLDTIVTASPRDTIILPVSPATYGVELEGFPEKCPVRDGGARVAVVAAGASSAIVRYSVTCELMLTVELVTRGVNPPADVRWRLTGPGVDRLKSGRLDDTLYFDDIRAGTYTFEVRDLPRRCQVTSPGRDGRRDIVVPANGGVFVQMSVECYDEAARPRIVSARSSSIRGAAALYMSYTDRQYDTDAVEWDITDCNGRSLLPKGSVTRRGVMAPARTIRDTMEFVTVLETTLSDESLSSACSRLRLLDRAGNSSEYLEMPLQSATGRPPRFTTFNAILMGFASLDMTFSVDDPDNDVVGFVAGYTLRPGALSGVANGPEDRVFLRSIGYPGTFVPSLEIGTAFLPPASDWRSGFLYVVDRGGNVVYLADYDLTR